MHGLFFMPGLPLLPDRKKASGESLAFFLSGKGIMSLMGYSKNYIMYWGGYE